MGISGYVAAAAAIAGGAEQHRQTEFTLHQGRKQERAAKRLVATEEKQRKQAAFSVLKRRKGKGERTPRETILTGPLGATGETGQAGKKLLGE